MYCVVFTEVHAELRLLASPPWTLPIPERGLTRDYVSESLAPTVAATSNSNVSFSVDYIGQYYRDGVCGNGVCENGETFDSQGSNQSDNTACDLDCPILSNVTCPGEEAAPCNGHGVCVAYIGDCRCFKVKHTIHYKFIFHRVEGV